MSLHFESIFSLILFIAYIFLLGHLLFRFFRFIFNFVFAKDKKEWQKQRKFRDYYIELKKLKSKNENVNVVEAEQYLKKRTLRRKYIFCAELFMFGGASLFLCAYDFFPIRAENSDVEQLFMFLFGCGSIFELISIFKLAHTSHDAVTPIELSKDLQELEKNKSKEASSDSSNNKSINEKGDIKSDQTNTMPFATEYNSDVHGSLLFYCQTDQHTMKSILVYKNGNTFYRGEEETLNYGSTMISRVINITEISKDETILLLKGEIELNYEYLNDSLKNNEPIRAYHILDRIEELNNILIELVNDEKFIEKINSMKFLFELQNDWTSSKFYYYETSDSFFEKKYHEEYLDTGTVCDGIFPISDEHLWKKIVESNSETGMVEFKRIRNLM